MAVTQRLDGAERRSHDLRRDSDPKESHLLSFTLLRSWVFLHGEEEEEEGGMAF